ncbi:MAG: hypothetical protein C1943_18725 [Halochromatium sp.]|nr:hypothetical protein [Halochromatium sp.]
MGAMMPIQLGLGVRSGSGIGAGQAGSADQPRDRRHRRCGRTRSGHCIVALAALSIGPIL